MERMSVFLSKWKERLIEYRPFIFVSFLRTRSIINLIMKTNLIIKCKEWRSVSLRRLPIIEINPVAVNLESSHQRSDFSRTQLIEIYVRFSFEDKCELLEDNTILIIFSLKIYRTIDTELLAVIDIIGHTELKHKTWRVWNDGIAVIVLDVIHFGRKNQSSVRFKRRRVSRDKMFITLPTVFRLMKDIPTDSDIMVIEIYRPRIIVIILVKKVL